MEDYSMRILEQSQETFTNFSFPLRKIQTETLTQKFLNKLELEEWPKIYLREHLHYWVRKYGLAVGPYKEIARRAEISERSVERYMPELLEEGNYKRTLRKHKGSIIEIDPIFLGNEDIFKKLKVLKNVYRKKGCGVKTGGLSGGLSGGLKNRPIAPSVAESQPSLARARNIYPSTIESSIRKCISPYSNLPSDDTTTRQEKKPEKGSSWKSMGSVSVVKLKNYNKLLEQKDFDVEQLIAFSKNALKKSVWSFDEATGLPVETFIDDDMTTGA